MTEMIPQYIQHIIDYWNKKNDKPYILVIDNNAYIVHHEGTHMSDIKLIIYDNNGISYIDPKYKVKMSIGDKDDHIWLKALQSMIDIKICEGGYDVISKYKGVNIEKQSSRLFKIEISYLYLAWSAISH